jgi:NADPH-dependent curcumin reductase CurA
MKAGDTVLVTAGAGATGSYAVQYAKRAGCHVVATCRNEAKSRILKETFAVDRVIDYSKENVADVLSTEYEGKINIAYEGVGGIMQAVAWNSLAPGGRLMVVGYISEYPHMSTTHSALAQQSLEMNSETSGSGIKNPLPPSDEMFWQGKTYVHDNNNQDTGSTSVEPDQQPRVAYGNVWPTDPELRQRALVEAYRLQYEEEINPVRALIDPREFRGIESVADAIDYMLTGEAIGKVCVAFD